MDDLIATLTHVESGLSVFIFYKPLDYQNFNGDYSFNDAYTEFFSENQDPCPPGNYFPSYLFDYSSILSTLKKKEAYGTWGLKIIDTTEEDFGSLGGWSLVIDGFCEEDYYSLITETGENSCILWDPNKSWSDGSVTRYYSFSGSCDG